MIRFLFWFFVWVITLFSASIDIRYTDGLHIKFKGWFSNFIKTEIGGETK